MRERVSWISEIKINVITKKKYFFYEVETYYFSDNISDIS